MHHHWIDGLNTEQCVKEVEKVASLKSNKKCFECGEPNPYWASVTLGIFLCIKCAGEHRSFGVHISVVRSLSLDSWTSKQVKFLELGGNKRAREFFGLGEADVALGNKEERWNSPEAEKYRSILKNEVSVALGLDDESEKKPFDLDPKLKKFKDAKAIGSSSFEPPPSPKKTGFNCISTCCTIL